MNGGMGGTRRMDYLQAEKSAQNIRAGNRRFIPGSPNLPGRCRMCFRSVAAFLRHQYSISYSPSHGAKDGKFHKVKVELVAPDGGPLSIVDQKGKKQKYQVLCRGRLSVRQKRRRRLIKLKIRNSKMENRNSFGA